MSKIIIDIGKDFATEPFGRYETDGKYNGEKFRLTHLIPAFKSTPNGIISVKLDNVADGWEYGSSFLQESFGELARIIGSTEISRLRIITSNEDYVIEIDDYIQAALSN